MKVLIINTIQFRINGVANVILSNMSSLLNSVNCEVAVTEWGEVNKRNRDSFIELSVKEYYLCSRQKAFFKYLYQLKKILKEDSFDIIHIHGNSGTMAVEARIAKKYSNARVIVHLHNSTCSHPKLFGPDSLLTRIMKRNADCLVACSKLAGDWLYKDHYVVLPNAIDLERFAFNAEKRKFIRGQYKISDDTFVIGHVGVFNEQKNHAFLLRVFAEYLKFNSNSRLLLVGDGAKKEDVVSLAKSLNIYDKVIFAGTQQDMPAFYSAFDIFVFPSLWEGLGIVDIEAQASGLTVLNSTAIPSEVKLSDRVVFKKIDDGVVFWATQIEELRVNYKDRYAPLEQLKECGYDVRDQASRLLQIYGER